jgi:hypothetical protein
MSRVTDICEWQKATTPEQVLALIADASEKVSDMCSGSGRCRMTIPPQTDDHDIAIGNALCAAKAFIDRAAMAGTVEIDAAMITRAAEKYAEQRHALPLERLLPSEREAALIYSAVILNAALYAPQATGAAPLPTNGEE